MVRALSVLAGSLLPEFSELTRHGRDAHHGRRTGIAQEEGC
jgi:hypothetical protein